jgi:hypothetical protein
MAKLSEKFGSVLKMPPFYKWFYGAQVFAGIASLAHLIQASTYLAQSNTSSAPPNSFLYPGSLEFTLIFYHIPLAISVTIGLLVTWKYWSWVITDRKR